MRGFERYKVDAPRDAELLVASDVFRANVVRHRRYRIWLLDESWTIGIPIWSPLATSDPLAEDSFFHLHGDDGYLYCVPFRQLGRYEVEGV